MIEEGWRTRVFGRTVFDRLEKWLMSRSPAARRRVALHVLIWSAVLGAVNVLLYALGIFDDSDLILITLILSWLAITITAADLVATTDVREESDNA